MVDAAPDQGLLLFVVSDSEGRQRVDPAGLPAGGGATDGAPAPTHRAFLRRVHGRRAAGHGVRVHEARRLKPLPPVSGRPAAIGPFSPPTRRPEFTQKKLRMKSCNNNHSRCSRCGKAQQGPPPCSGSSHISFYKLL